MSVKKNPSSYEPPPESGDRYVPLTFQGRIEPNFYCRGWNSKRLKYCSARAGQATDHPGEGRCINHGGGAIVKHGRYRKLKTQKFLELVEEMEQDSDPLDPFPELHLMRALVLDWVNRYTEITDALLAWHHSFTPEYQAQVEQEFEIWQEEGNHAGTFVASMPVPPRPRQVLDITSANKLLSTIVGTIIRIEKLQNATAISRTELLLLTQEMGRVVERVVKEPKLLEAIKDGWDTIQTRA